MKKQLIFLVVLFFAVTGLWAATITVGPGGPPTYNFATIQAAVTASNPGDVINVAAGKYIESNILVNKSITIQGIAATRDLVILAPAAEDGNVDNAFANNAQNGFIIAAQAVTIRNLTINGWGNPALTVGKNNFRAGIVTLDLSQPSGGVWNNLHVDNVSVKYAWRRGISVFPRNVSGTVIENSNVEYVAFNQGMYLAGHSLVLNNTVKHCFQGIVQNPDATTPTGLFKMNGNNLSEIGNFAGCFGYPSSQPRAIEFDAVDPTFRTVEIENNTINDNGFVGLVGTVGIYTRRANAASIISNNTISLTSGVSYSVGTQSVGMILGWSYSNGFTARLNHVSVTGYGIGIVLIGAGTSASPMILEGNILSSVASARLDTADGTGIYIANQYLFSTLDKYESYVKIQANNSISGFVRGIEAVKLATSTYPLTVIVHNNSISGNTGKGIEASSLSTPVDATNNYWGNCSGPLHATLNPSGTCNGVSNNVNFIPWWCDAGMTVAAPTLSAGMAIRNTNTGAQYTSAQLTVALASATSGQTLYIAPGTVSGTTNFNYPGKTVYIIGTGILSQSILDGVLTVTAGNLIVQNGIEFTNSISTPDIVVNGGSLKLRNCILENGGTALLTVTGGLVDAGTKADNGGNIFQATLPAAAISNTPLVGLYAIGNNWGDPSGPTIASNPFGTGGPIVGAGKDSVYYAPFTNGPITTIGAVKICAGMTTVDIPVTATNFKNVGKFMLTFGFTPAQMVNPIIVYKDAAFSSWGPAFTWTTDPAGILKVWGSGPVPATGITLSDGTILFTIRFTIIPNQGLNSTAAVFFNENAQGTDCEYAGVAPSYLPFNDIRTSSYYISGGATLNLRHKISGVFTYYNAANTVLTGADITVKIYKSSDIGHSTLLGTCVTNGSGYYEFSNLCPDDTYDIVATSTHATDGSVNTTDAAQVNSWPAASYVIEKVRFYAGDVGLLGPPFVNPDWSLNSTDALRIQQNFVNGKAFDRPWTFWKTNQFIAGNPATESYPTVNVPIGADVTANMYGLCTGDFNRSYNPAMKKTSSKTLSLIYGRSMQVNSNQEFDLPIRIVHASSVGAVSLILNFPADLVDVKDVLINSTSGQLDWAVIDNQLRIGWNSTVAADLAAYDNLITLRLATRETFKKDASIRLALTADPLNELANNHYDVIGNAILSIDVVEASTNGIGEQSGTNGISMHNYPNPFSSNTTIAYSLPFSGKVTIEIRNSMGETVETLVNEIQTAGDHSLKLTSAGLPQGVYTAAIRLSNNANVATGIIKLVVSK